MGKLNKNQLVGEQNLLVTDERASVKLLNVYQVALQNRSYCIQRNPK